MAFEFQNFDMDDFIDLVFSNSSRWTGEANEASFKMIQALLLGKHWNIRSGIRPQDKMGRDATHHCANKV